MKPIIIALISLMVGAASSSNLPHPSILESFEQLAKADVAPELEGLTEIFAKLKAINTRPSESKILLGHEAPPTSPRYRELKSEGDVKVLSQPVPTRKRGRSRIESKIPNVISRKQY